MDIEFAVTSTPGEHVQAGRGRLINMIAEPVNDDRQRYRQKGQEKVVWKRAVGTVMWGWHDPGKPPEDPPPWPVPDIATEPFRGAFYVSPSKLIAVWGENAYTFDEGGGVATAKFTGLIPGEVEVIFSRNNKETPEPDVIGVVPGVGAFKFSLTAGTVTAFPDADILLNVNSVTYLQTFFVFSAPDGTMQTTVEGDTTNIEALDYNTAGSRADALLRVVPLSGSQLLAMGTTSIEVWGPPIRQSGFPFAYITTINMGLIGPYAVTGYEDGFSNGIFFAAPDNCVYTLNGYRPEKISNPDLERAIKRTLDKHDIRVSCFNAEGRGMVVVQSSEWCWHFDCGTQKWHERQSYLETFWRHYRPVFAFDSVWICGDVKTPALYAIDHDIETEAGDPLPALMEGVVDAFPAKQRIARIDINYTHGIGILRDPNSDPENLPEQLPPDWVAPPMVTPPMLTDPQMLISYSTNGGVTYSDPMIKRFGKVGTADGQATLRNCGISRGPSYRVRVVVSDPIFFSIMGGAIFGPGET